MDWNWETETFPVMQPWKRGEPRYNGPSVPWAMVQPHERQARRNHGDQSLARLAERGGLSPCELLAVLEDRPWRAMDAQGACDSLAALVKRWRGWPNDAT